MGFDAARAVEPLDYDFSDYADGAKGTIPEPLQEDLDTLFAELREIGSEAGVVSLAAAGTGSEAHSALADVPQDLLDTLTSRLVAATARICKGSPTEDEINALPVRVRQAFVDWLLSELTNPTKQTSASRASVVRSNGAVLAG